MIKNAITLSFAERLRRSLIDAGYQSNRSTTGVDIQKFAKKIHHSPQICRKYLRGEGIPEPQKFLEIADLLNVSPGWLMFGDCHATSEQQDKKITINRNLLHHLFTHISQLCASTASTQYLPNFWLELTEDLQSIETSEEQSKKIIDFALSSFKHLAQNK